MTTPAPFLVDPLDPTQFLVATCRVWRGPASGAGWAAANAISPILDGSANAACDGDALIRSIAAMPLAGGSEVVYVGMYGSANGGANLPGHVLTATFNPSERRARMARPHPEPGHQRQPGLELLRPRHLQHCYRYPRRHRQNRLRHRRRLRQLRPGGPGCLPLHRWRRALGPPHRQSPSARPTPSPWTRKTSTPFTWPPTPASSPRVPSPPAQQPPLTAGRLLQPGLPPASRCVDGRPRRIFCPSAHRRHLWPRDLADAAVDRSHAPDHRAGKPSLPDLCNPGRRVHQQRPAVVITNTGSAALMPPPSPPPATSARPTTAWTLPSPSAPLAPSWSPSPPPRPEPGQAS